MQLPSSRAERSGVEGSRGAACSVAVGRQDPAEQREASQRSGGLPRCCLSDFATGSLDCARDDGARLTNMSAFFFWTASALMLIFGAAVIINRNPVASALSLVVCFLGLAALFISLDAFFIGIIQVLVYAGAVMVLFLFIIMLLDLRAEERRRLNLVAFIGGGAVALTFAAQLFAVIGHLRSAQQ